MVLRVPQDNNADKARTPFITLVMSVLIIYHLQRTEEQTLMFITKRRHSSLVLPYLNALATESDKNNCNAITAIETRDDS